MYPHALLASELIGFSWLRTQLPRLRQKNFLYEFNKQLCHTWKGFINATLPTSTAQTLRGQSVKVLHTTGTVSLTTAVTGDGTKFVEEELLLGLVLVLVFDPMQFLLGTSYQALEVIQYYSIIFCRINWCWIGICNRGIEICRYVYKYTVLNSGLQLVKGVNYSDFVPTGTTIPVSTNTDNIKAVYWLSDSGTVANTVTNNSACGCAVSAEVNKGLHYAYVIDGTGSTFINVYRYNLRATGAIASGKMTLSIAPYIMVR
jgi:hypothetical protein